jgi:hypothetical protein
MANIHPVALPLSLSDSSYEKKPSQEIPTIMGFASAYPFHYHTKSPMSDDATFYDQIFKDSSSSQFACPIRLRLSQFIILPPFQRAGHGGRFYDAILKNARADPQVREIPIEDPNNAFEDLRDRRDLHFLLQQQAFKGIKPPVSKQWVEETRKKFKMPLVLSP